MSSRRSGRHRSRWPKSTTRRSRQPASNFGGEAVAGALRSAPGRARRDHRVDADGRGSASAQGIDRAALVEKEITAKVAGGHRRGRSRPGIRRTRRACRARSLEQVRQPIRTFLTQERMQAVRAKYIDDAQEQDRCARDARPAAAEGGDGGEQPGAGPRRRADPDRRVLRLSVTVLPEGRSGPQAGVRHLRRSRPTWSIANIRCRTTRTRGRRPKRDCAPTNRGSSGRITTSCSPASGGWAAPT